MGLFKNKQKKLFSCENSECCALCEFSTKLQDINYVLCSREGVVSAGFKCRKFCYDPLKREPRSLKIMNEYSPEDFSIE